MVEKHSIDNWLAIDPDTETRTQLAALIERAEFGDIDATQELESAFSSQLSFGTAGLRARMGPGPNRMNEAVVRRTTAGLAKYLNEHGGSRVVIGFDARHKSEQFARATAEVMAHHGIAVEIFAGPVPTPLLAFAINKLRADAGVMVTASHNPAYDNGFKVYLGDGSQIISPVDQEISANIASLPLSASESPPAEWSFSHVTDEIVDEYITRATELVTCKPVTPIRVVYTPLHGVGRDLFLSSARACGFRDPIDVEVQSAPDPNFPTTQFPNPEEPGTLDIAIEVAQANRADLLIAHDPDADRCSVAIPVRDEPDCWQRLTGDQVGAILAWWLFVKKPTLGDAQLTNDVHSGRRVLAQSIVSGTMLELIAREAKCDFVTTLTGFKWIGRVPNLAFGYEEALGYCVDPHNVRDKDGITAALLVMELASYLASAGLTIGDVIDELDRKYGVHATDQLSIRLQAGQRAELFLDSIRSEPLATTPGLRITRMDDLSLGLGTLPPTDGIALQFENQCKMIIRPSGTEPKVKIYLQVSREPAVDIEAERASAKVLLEKLRDVALHWFGLSTD
ncbi:MAG: hypothetical protein RIQ64_1706 [Actinomycetota bacterium]|jgi:phosphomannomutase